MTDPIEKYIYYVERLQINIPTPEPTEFIKTAMPTFSPTQSIPSPSTNDTYLLQYIIVVSIATSLFTTCCVICTNYCCSNLRIMLRNKYLRNIASSTSSVSSEEDSNSSICENSSSEDGVFWFDDIYRISAETAESAESTESTEYIL